MSRDILFVPIPAPMTIVRPALYTHLHFCLMPCSHLTSTAPVTMPAPAAIAIPYLTYT